jgi:hypothetical protein
VSCCSKLTLVLYCHGLLFVLFGEEEEENEAKPEDSSIENPIANTRSGFALFTRLPSSLLYIPKEFLILKDFRSLINSSRDCFQEIKFQTIFFDLSAAASQRFCLHEEFRNDVKLRIRDQRSQISIQLTQSSLEKGILPAIGGVHSMKIHFLSVLRGNPLLEEFA